MKGPKIENIRDPKWVGKKVMWTSDLENNPCHLKYVGSRYIIITDKFGEECAVSCIKPNGFFEWIEPEEEKKPEFPYKEPKKKKTVAYAIIKRAGHPPRLSDYLSESKINIKNFELDSTKILQFPAVTKNGTVLEFEVDDE